MYKDIKNNNKIIIFVKSGIAAGLLLPHRKS